MKGAGKKTSLAVAAGVILIALLAYGAIYFSQKNKNKASETPSGADILFSNPDGKYSFSYPAAWNAAVNQYNRNNSLFGPEASSSVGLGGVEIFPNQTSIESFLNGVSAQYSGKTGIVIGGIPGIRVSYKNFPISGEEAVFLKDGKIYNIYINSENSQNIGFFNKIVSSFKLIQ